MEKQKMKIRSLVILKICFYCLIISACYYVIYQNCINENKENTEKHTLPKTWIVRRACEYANDICLSLNIQRV